MVIRRAFKLQWSKKVETSTIKLNNIKLVSKIIKVPTTKVKLSKLFIVYTRLTLGHSMSNVQPSCKNKKPETYT